MKSWRFSILLVALLAGGFVVNAWEYLGEAHVDRKSLKDFPTRVAAWEQIGTDEQFDSETLAVLRASDYLLRNFQSPDGRITNFYVGYYASQRDGATYHSPLNCLPGSGWVMSEPGKVTITPRGRAPFVANKYVIRNGDHKELLVYWYQGRGRSVASEYWGKVYTVFDSVRLRRSDGAMVRITTTINDSKPGAVQSAMDSAIDLAADSASILPEFIPD
jgi:EpsI family protein